MKRITSLLAAAGLAAIVGVAPVAQAQTVHFVGAGSSAQFNPSGIGADALALTKVTAGNCVYHWSAKNGGNLVDLRGTVSIPLEPANSWIVWIASQDGSACPTNSGSSSLGGTNVTDIWMDESVDSTVGVRSFLAQNTVANGGSGLAVETIALAAGNLLGSGAANTWPDNAADVQLPTTVQSAVGTNQSGVGDVHVNAGLTDIRPEDAFFATTRSMTAINATRTGLGYNSTANVGQSILTSEGTGSKATPVKFALTGNDPITKVAVRSYQTIPIGAAPIIFIYNNAGDASNVITNLASGVLGTGLTAGAGWPTFGTSPYAAANLFDGSTSCDTSNKAFGSATNTAHPVHVFLREPLSGTMNTTEFNVFRTTGNTGDSQEQNVFPGTVSAPIDNPLSAKPCGCGADGSSCAGAGDRSRGIGTGEIVGTATTGVLGTPYGLGYIFYGFSNASKFKGSANFNYLTLDGVDPLGLTNGATPGALPNCGGPCAANTFWPAAGGAPAGYSYPTLRNGTYKAWSIYRWVVPNPDTDAYGPTALAHFTENNIDASTNVADFVPFQACPASDPTCVTAEPTDGLDVYRSHFTQSAIDCSYTATTQADENECNGPATSQNAKDNGDALGGFGGGVVEHGGDVGGLIIGWDNAIVTTANDTTKGNACLGQTKVTHVSGRLFGLSGTSAAATTGTPAALEGNTTVTLNGAPVTVSSCIKPTTTILYLQGALGVQTKVPFSYYLLPTSTGTNAGDNGVIGKKN